MNEQIISRIIEDDASAYEKVFHEYYSGLCRYALRFVRDPDQAEELVQDTFVKIWQRRKSLSIRHSLKSYLYQSVRNQCLNFLKHQDIVRDFEQTAPIPLHNDSDTVVLSELEALIVKAVNDLPPERQKIFRMSRDEGLRYSEIADQLGISVKTVENQIGRALKYLREELADFLVIAGIICLYIIKEWG